MIVACPSCRAQYRLDASRLRDGKGRLRCARCRTVFPVTAEGAAEAPRQAPAPPRAGLDIALLAAEASPLQKRLHSVLRELGLRLALADDGPNALDVARRSRPRLVVATHWLPALSGAELVRALRDEPALAATRTLLVGGPTRRLRWPASPAAIHGCDAHLGMEAREPEIEATVRALLGMPGGALPLPPEDGIRLHARVAVADLRLYLAAELEAGRQEGRLHDSVTHYLSRARAHCLERFPELRSESGGLAAWDDEVRLSLRRQG